MFSIGRCPDSKFLNPSSSVANPFADAERLDVGHDANINLCGSEEKKVPRCFRWNVFPGLSEATIRGDVMDRKDSSRREA